MKAVGEVNYIQTKQRKPLFIAIILILILFMTLQIAIITKLAIELTSLYKENESLKGLVDMKSSQVADLEENCKDLFIQLEELKYGN